MNLADAIRQAASGNGFSKPPLQVVESPRRPAASKKAAKEEFVEAVKSGGSGSSEGLHLASDSDLTVTSPQNTTIALPVKFELYLSPEQLTNLFKGVVAAQHSVMTLRETARYLRIPGRKLEEMAQLGQIPAFLIEGKWRFARNSVDEWLAKQSARKEMEA